MFKMLKMFKMFKVFKKSIILVFIAALFFSQSASAIFWGIIEAVPESTVSYVERYGLQEVSISVTYKPAIYGWLPVYADVYIEGKPDWLTVTPTPPVLVLMPNRETTVKLAMAVKQQDIIAGTTGSIDVAIRGTLVTGALLRQIKEAKFSIIVGYNPFTEIAISAVKPIERTAPDRELPFVINIYNYGNSRVIVDLSPEKEPGNWRYVISPSTVVIEPKQPGEETFPFATVTITLTSPHGTAISYHNDWQDFAIRAKARSEAPYYEYRGGKWQRVTDETELITSYETTAYFLAKNKGFYVPGFDAIILIAGIALACIIFSKKK